jgi:hypothetical protein
VVYGPSLEESAGLESAGAIPAVMKKLFPRPANMAFVF